MCLLNSPAVVTRVSRAMGLVQRTFDEITRMLLAEGRIVLRNLGSSRSNDSTGRGAVARKFGFP